MGHEDNLVRIAENGRLSIPARQRRLLGLEGGGMVVVRVENGELTLRPVRKVLADIQARAGRYLTGPENTVDCLLAERRAEAARDGT